MKFFMLLAVLVLNPINLSAKDTETSYFKDFLVFLQVSGAEETQKTMLKSMFAQMKKAPNAKPVSIDRMEAIMDSEISELNKSLFPIYKKHLSHEDLKKIIIFYQSAAGKRLVESQPKIVEDSFQVGVVWGQGVAKRVNDELTN